MIGPLAQRQVHMASNMEGLRQAHDMSEQLQREAGRKQAAEDRLAEAKSEVPQIPKAEGLRTEERQGRQGHPGSRGKAPAEDLDEEEEAEDPGAAKSAERHLDFLA